MRGRQGEWRGNDRRACLQEGREGVVDEGCAADGERGGVVERRAEDAAGEVAVLHRRRGRLVHPHPRAVRHPLDAAALEPARRAARREDAGKRAAKVAPGERQ
jgi:hypothetical protein